MGEPGDEEYVPTALMMASVLYVQGGRVYSGYLESETDGDGSQRTVLVASGGRVLEPHEVAKVLAKPIEGNLAVLSRAVEAGYWVEDR